MTKHSDRKAKARAYAAEHGVSYTAALRHISALDMIDDAEAAAQSSDAPLWLEIQQEQREDGVLPYPFAIRHTGLVFNQRFWQGDPLLLIGFETPDSTERSITLTRMDWFNNPQAAVGLAPVFADFERNWATYTGNVVSVTAIEHELAEDPGRTVHTRVISDDDSIEFTLDAGPLLHSVPTPLLEEFADHGWYDHPELERLVDLAALHGNPDADRMIDYLNVHDDRYATVRLDPQQADIWVRTIRGIDTRPRQDQGLEVRP